MILKGGGEMRQLHIGVRLQRENSLIRDGDLWDM